MHKRKVEVTPFEIAQRFIGMKEIPGQGSNPQVLAMLQLDQTWPKGDEVPWCSAFMNYICWLLRLPRSKSLRARSWLNIGMEVSRLGEVEPEVGFDVVILKRGRGPQPGSNVINAPGHVGFFAGWPSERSVALLGGNQGDEVNVRRYASSNILGIRRL